MVAGVGTVGTWAVTSTAYGGGWPSRIWGTDDKDASQDAITILEGPWASWGKASASLSTQVRIPGVQVSQHSPSMSPQPPPASPSHVCIHVYQKQTRMNILRSPLVQNLT